MIGRRACEQPHRSSPPDDELEPGPSARSAARIFDDGRRGLGAVKAGPLAGIGALSLRPAAGRAGIRTVLGAALAKPEATWATPS